MARNVLSCAALTLLFKGLSLLYIPSGWLTLFACICVYALLGAAVHFAIVLSADEWRGILKKIRRPS